jgi:glycosyltransferase involved in cell wall biosynthesis
MRVLFLVPWPSEAASTRLRVEQYLPYLAQEGVQTIVRSFMDPDLYRMVYEPGNTLKKIALVTASVVRRLRDVITASSADVVFIHREALPFGVVGLEKAISSLGVPIILDFDDAIYLSAGSKANPFMRYLKRPNKVSSLIKIAQAVVVGNSHLQSYALQFNKSTVVLPTPVDTDYFRPVERSADQDKVVIGWMGSGTTSRYVDELEEPLRRILDRYPQVSLSIVGGLPPRIEKLPRAEFPRWTLEREREHLGSFDIGLMPYPDTEWARGKCAFKALLYMSMGIPAVCSDVGVVGEIIDSGRTGYLIRDSGDWFDVLDQLVRDRELRQRVGAAGREVVLESFSREGYAPRFLEILRAAARGRPVETAPGVQPAPRPKPLPTA